MSDNFDLEAKTIVKDSFFCVCNIANNFVFTDRLIAPIENVSKVRILSSEKCLAKINFLPNSYIYDSSTNQFNLSENTALIGDENLWYKINEVRINNINVQIIDQNLTSKYPNGIDIVFQFL